MIQVYNFLKELHDNNNKEWFTAHYQEYQAVRSKFEAFTYDLMCEIFKFDKDINPSLLSVKDCTWRIYRDVRFSKDKRPYKNHMGCYFVKGGKKSPYAGYYFHIEPYNDEYRMGNMIFVGAYMPDSKQIASVREELAINGEPILEAIESARGFMLYDQYALKRMPAGSMYESVTNPALQNLIRQRQYLLVKNFNYRNLTSPKLTRMIASDFKRGYKFNSLINRCIDYALEEGNI